MSDGYFKVRFGFSIFSSICMLFAFGVQPCFPQAQRSSPRYTPPVYTPPPTYKPPAYTPPTYTPPPAYVPPPAQPVTSSGFTAPGNKAFFDKDGVLHKAVQEGERGTTVRPAAPVSPSPIITPPAPSGTTLQEDMRALANENSRALANAAAKLNSQVQTPTSKSGDGIHRVPTDSPAVAGDTARRVFRDFNERNAETLLRDAQLGTEVLRDNAAGAGASALQNRVESQLSDVANEGMAQRKFGQSYQQLDVEKKHEVDFERMAWKAPLAAATGDLKDWAIESLQQIFDNVDLWKKEIKAQSINDLLNQLLGLEEAGK